MSVATDLLKPLLSQVTIEVETTAGSFTTALGTDGGPGVATRVLKPRVTVRIGTETIATATPAGDPKAAWWSGLLVPAVGVVGVLVLVLAVRGAMR